MYSRKVTQNNILRAQEIIRAAHELPPRWELTYSTEEERTQMRTHFKLLLDKKGYLIRDFTREERLWILCESTLCKLDFDYFISNYVKIEDWSARINYFRPNKAQRVILNLFAENEERGFAQWFMFLKARQLGITTLFQALLAHRVFFYRNIGAYTGSAEEKKSREMVGKFEFLWNNMDWWIRPRQTTYRAGELLEYGDLNSSVNVQWGNQKGGIARGATPVVAHLSELSTFEHPELLVDASLALAMHENPFALLALESTANGIGNWWHKTWEYNSSMDARGLARYKPVFLPWYVGDDLYPTEWEYRRRPAPVGWVPPQYVEDHAKAAESYVRENVILGRALGSNWSMSVKQKWWYYLQYEEHRQKKTLHVLFQELPANAAEAFQSSNPSVFSIETIVMASNKAIASPPIGVYQVAGTNIPFIYWDQKTEGEVIPLQCLSQNGDLLDTFELQPVIQDGWPDSDPDLRLYIWEWPEKGETYGIYCDPSEGVDQDSSVVGVIKRATPWHPDEQVAEWASGKVAPHDLWAFIYCLAHLYTVKGPNGEWREPIVVIETNLAGGDAAQTEMLKRGYANFHREMDLTMMGLTGPEFEKRARAIKDRIGWRTGRANRPKMISLFRKSVRDGGFVPRSPWLVREMQTFEWNIDKQRVQAAEGMHDDRIMGPAMLLCHWYDPEIYGTTPSAFLEQKAWESELEKAPVYMGDKVIGERAYSIEPTPEKVDSRRYS